MGKPIKQFDQVLETKPAQKPTLGPTYSKIGGKNPGIIIRYSSLIDVMETKKAQITQVQILGNLTVYVHRIYLVLVAFFRQQLIPKAVDRLATCQFGYQCLTCTVPL